jgi:ferredoxin
MRVDVDADRCSSSGTCVLLAPDLFAQDDDGIAYILTATIEPSAESAAVTAMRACPSNALAAVD